MAISANLDGTDVYGMMQGSNSRMAKNRLDNRDHLKWLNKTGGRKVPILGDMLFRFYRICPGYLRRLVVRTLMRLEGGGLYSVTVRRILYTYHDIEVGMYTGLLAAIGGGLPPGTKVGRYTSMNPRGKVFGD